MYYDNYATEHDFDDVELYDAAEFASTHEPEDEFDEYECPEWGDGPEQDQPDPYQCPQCQSYNVERVEYDWGHDSATGYHDAGIGGYCTDCRHRWEV